jgi:hypothetical protein
VERVELGKVLGLEAERRSGVDKGEGETLAFVGPEVIRRA